MAIVARVERRLWQQSSRSVTLVPCKAHASLLWQRQLVTGQRAGLRLMQQFASPSVSLFGLKSFMTAAQIASEPRLHMHNITEARIVPSALPVAQRTCNQRVRFARQEKQAALFAQA